MGKRKQNLHPGAGDALNLLKQGTFPAPSPHVPLGRVVHRGWTYRPLNNLPHSCELRWGREWPSALRQLEPHSGVLQDGTVVNVR